MRLAILSRGPRLYSTKRIAEEARLAGHAPTVLDPLLVSLSVADDEVQVMMRGRPLEFDAVLPRIGYSITQHGVAVLRHFERRGTYCANSSRSVIRSRDKLHATQALSRHGIPMPRTVYVRDPRDIDSAIDHIGSGAVVVKVTEGTQGNGVLLCHNRDEARRIVEAMLRAGVNVILQQYVRESHGVDVRVLVVGESVVASMRRRARGDEFRSNYHLNGMIEPIDLPAEYARVALESCRILGLNIAGVDLLEGRDGPMLLEVNSSPGLQGIEKATGVNVASHIVKQISDNALFANVNLDPLMRTRKGHGVLRLPIRSTSNLIGKSLELIFESMEQNPVFALVRAGELLWLPSNETIIGPGDEILCFGPLRSLRERLSFLIENSVESSLDIGQEWRQ